MNLRTKASTALVATTDFYSTALALLEAEVAQKDALLAQVGEQLKAAGCVHPELEATAATVDGAQLHGLRVTCRRCERTWTVKVPIEPKRRREAGAK